MKKITLLFSILSFSFACSNVIAQNSATPVTPDSIMNSLKKGGEVQGFISSPPGADLLRNAITNRDGTRTIKKGQQTPEANELNRKYCESIGAKDVTNESDLTIGPGTVHAGFCVGPVGGPPSANAQPVPGNGTGRVFLPIPGKKIEPQSSVEFLTQNSVRIVAWATNGSSPLGGNYRANSYADFYDLPAYGQASAVGIVNEVQPCIWRQQTGMGPGSGRLSGFATCVATVFTAYSEMKGCYAGTCSAGHGVVDHY